jgi:preprotein translocase subunit YajC
MFSSPAWAQAAGEATAGPGALEALLPIVLIFVVFYFLLFRPQQKKLKQHREMLAAARRGDRIVTGGGIIGTITKVVDDNEVQVEIAEGVRVRVQRALISAILAKTEPVPARKDSEVEQDGGSGGETIEAAKESVPKSSLLKKALGGRSKPE